MPSSATDQSPVLLPLMAVCTSRPRRGPAARALTTRRWLMPKSDSCASATSSTVTALTLSSSATMPANGRSPSGSAVTTVSCGQRQAHAQLLGLAQRGAGGAHGAHLVHRGDEGVVGREVRGIRPVLEVHRAAAGEAAPDLLGDQRQQRGRDPGEHLERGVERVERGVRRRSVAGAGVPEPFPRPADVPVGQRVDELAHRLAGARDVVGVHLALHGLDERRAAWPAGSGRAGRSRPSTTGRRTPVPAVGRVRVEAEEVPAVPQRDEHLAHALADALLGDDEVAAAQDRRWT